MEAAAECISCLQIAQDMHRGSLFPDAKFAETAGYRTKRNRRTGILWKREHYIWNAEAGSAAI